MGEQESSLMEVQMCVFFPLFVDLDSAEGLLQVSLASVEFCEAKATVEVVHGVGLLGAMLLVRGSGCFAMRKC